MGTNTEREEQQYDLKVIHGRFTGNLESLGVFITNLAPVAKNYDKALMKRVEEIFGEALEVAGVSKHALRRKGRKESRGLELTKEQARQVVSVLKGLPTLTASQVGLLYRSSFVLLLSYFDFMLADLIHYFHQRHPESLSGKELSITLNELKLCGNLAEAVECVVNKEVDRVLYENLESQKRYLDTYLKIDVKENVVCWNKINEAMERRHIIVHNDSKINRRYLKNVDFSVLPERAKDLKEGARIAVKEDYFASIFEEILIAGIILIQSCWRKWEKDDVASADDYLISDVYDALLKEKWTVAERVGLFSKDCRVSNERNRLYFDVNYCQSLKWQNKKDELETEVERFDISTLSPIYVLALSALKSDTDNFYKNVEKAIIVDGMQKHHFMEWPLFRELRQDPDYENRIEAAFSTISREDRE